MKTAVRRLNTSVYGILSGEKVRLIYLGYEEEKMPNKIYSLSVSRTDNQARATAQLTITVRDKTADLVFQHLAKIEELLNGVDADAKFRDNNITAKYIWLAEESSPLYDTQFEMVKATHTYTIRYVDNEEAN